MKHINNYKIFESKKNIDFPQTEEEINNVCKEYTILNYTINDDMSIDVNGNVSFWSNKKFKKLPLKFNHVEGDFRLTDNELETLEGFPKYIKGNINISFNNLKSLKGLPDIINNGLNCKYNLIDSFDNSPKKIKNYLDISGNMIKSLYNIPDVTGNLMINRNPIYLLIYRFSDNNYDADLYQEFIDYSIIRGDKLIMNRLKTFYKDFELREISDSAMSLLEKHYEIIQ